VFKRLREGLFKRDDQPDVEQAGAAVEQEAPEEEFVEEPPMPAPPFGAPAHQAPGALPEVEAAAEPRLEPADETLDERRTPPRNLFRFSLGRTRQLFGRVNDILEADEITDEVWDELEDTLISGDVGVTTTERLLGTLRERVEAEHLERGSELRAALKEELALLLGEPEPLVVSETSPISVYLVVGVNGVGKTTSIAKLANLLKRDKHRVLLAAGDTFRAAAAEQIKTWGERIGTPVISHQYGADPGAVVFDAMQAAQARGADVLIVDTAGRLHTKFNLMEELKKIMRVLQKYDDEAPHEVLLVIDATTGQNGFLQAKQFVQDAGVSGVILTKLDGTARGGIAFAVASELGLPIKFIGTGESVKDIAPFDADAFVDALFEEA
ncbi:MAG TPA: signal recognition particle-docking protein FtsY, partial [Ktedonobacterales bacterium]|nr:signal recognition particle-docking protein FtsY [Ktedonobacterales bacterium]